MRKPTQREREAEAKTLDRMRRFVRRELRWDASAHVRAKTPNDRAFWEGAMSSDGIIADWCRREALKLRRGK